MNENINLVEILKDCPRGTKLWSPLCGEVTLKSVYFDSDYCIDVITENGIKECFTKYGNYFKNYKNVECLLFPSKENRDWGTFKPNKPKFDPKTLQPFDKVLVRDYSSGYWNCDFFSSIDDSTSNHKHITISSAYIFCIPYNNETKHLVGTSEEAPEYYRWWEN